jgi:alginate O-acetyltransferase complex protein AlgI
MRFSRAGRLSMLSDTWLYKGKAWLFSSVSFLYYFLPVVLALYFLAPAKCKNLVLLLASFAFYFWGEPGLFFLMAFSQSSQLTCMEYGYPKPKTAITQNSPDLFVIISISVLLDFSSIMLSLSTI